MIELGLARTKELLAEAVALKGEDYVYTTPEGDKGSEDYQPVCLYVHGDQPGCIVGHVLHAAGVPLDNLGRYEGDDATVAIRTLIDDETIASDLTVGRLLRAVQDRQDSGIPWGQAVQQALAEPDSTA